MVTSLKTLTRVQELLRDRAFQQGIANACDKAYGEGTGYGHEPFTAESKPELLACNLAGAIAVINGAQLIAYQRGASTAEEIDEDLPGILSEIAEIPNDVEPGDEMFSLLVLANATWNQSQPMRTDKGALGRADRMNVFALLPIEEVLKDLFQVRAAARYIVENLSE